MLILIYGLLVFDMMLIIFLPLLFAFRTPRNVHPKRKLYYILGIAAYIGANIATMFMRGNIIIMLTLSVSYVLLCQLLFRRGKMALFYQAVYMILLFLIQIAASSIAGFLVQNAYALGPMVTQCLILVIKFAMETVYTLLIIQVVRVRNMADVSKRQLSGLFSIPIFSLFNIITMVTVGSIYYLVYGYLLLIVNIVIILAVNLYCLYLYYDISRNQEMKRQLEFARRQNELMYKYYESMGQRIQNSRKVVHDIRNHINAIEQLYASGNQAGGSSYVKDVHALLDSLGLKNYTSNRMLNMILNDKLSKARQLHIKTQVSLEQMDIDFMKDMDITTVFSNLLDNAIEAAGNAAHGFIEMKSVYFNDMLTVYIKNPVGSGAREDGGSPLPEDVSQRNRGPRASQSSPRHVEAWMAPGHMGVGLSNVARTVKKYHGELSVSVKNEIFCASLLIPWAADGHKNKG